MGVSNNDEYTNAFECFMKAAVQGSAITQYNVGQYYSLVKNDSKKAYEWYLLASEQNLSSAQIEIGFLYKNGIGLEQDFQQAIKWFTKAAKSGDLEAQEHIKNLSDDLKKSLNAVIKLNLFRFINSFNVKLLLHT